MSPERVERLRSQLVYLVDATAREKRNDYWHGRQFALEQAIAALDELIAEEAES